MKTIITFACLLNLAISLAQSSFDFKNAHWYLTGANWDADEFTVASKEYFQSSSLMGTVDATDRVYYKFSTTVPFQLDGTDHKQFFIRQDSATGVVYIKTFDNESKEYVLYDFNLKMGDTIKTVLTEGMEGVLIVTKVATEQYQGTERKVVEAKLNGKEESKTFRFIDGVGTTNGFLVRLSIEQNDVMILRCAHTNNQLIYSNGGECSATPKQKPRPPRPQKKDQ